ncbi:hypothetical protein C8F01DRAFT_994251, partial [Mycena amicta]
RTTIPLLDLERRVIGVLGGTPRDAGWTALASQGNAFVEERIPRVKVSIEKQQHRRAQTAFPAIARGVSHGGGQTEPGVLHENIANTHATNEILQHEFFGRVVGFTRVLMMIWAPTLFGYYSMVHAALLAWKPSLEIGWPFARSVFAACTINFGRAVSRPHLDYGNLAWGWCAITALGGFDPDRGGHLILWELRLVIRFPPGSTILIPSAAIHHSNTPIGINETRSSFVQYTAGGLFRWVDNGCRTNDDFERYASSAEKSGRDISAVDRWERGIGMLSLVDDV